MASRIQDLDTQGVASMLDKWDLKEFVDFVQEKNVDGRKLLDITEGIVKLWRPRVNAKKFIEFIAEVKMQPDKYIEVETDKSDTQPKVKDTNIRVNNEVQYQIINKRNKETASTSTRVEEILKKIVPAKSFLYRNQPANDKSTSSYVPMDVGIAKKPKRFFRLSSIDDFRLSKTENFGDRGYYQVQTNSMYVLKSYNRTDSRKYKSLTAKEDLESVSEEHFYEDLNYYDNDKEDKDINELRSHNNIKPRLIKVQELLSSFKLPFFKKSGETEEKKLEDEKADEIESDGHIYEESENVTSTYESMDSNTQEDRSTGSKTKLPVEEYLIPVGVNKEYCDVANSPKEDSILSYILNIFENLGMKRETTEEPPPEPFKTNSEKVVEEKPRSNMADRPLPVPVENEPYFMDIDRTEAENLLRGQPDGTFVLRPSSQPDHAYTLTVSCSNAVHNVGVRRRPDGRLALGFARRGERSFDSVTSLLRHHKKQRLLLVAGGDVCGATALLSPPQYYQTPSELVRPVKLLS